MNAACQRQSYPAELQKGIRITCEVIPEKWLQPYMTGDDDVMLQVPATGVQAIISCRADIGAACKASPHGIV